MPTPQGPTLITPRSRPAQLPDGSRFGTLEITGSPGPPADPDDPGDELPDPAGRDAPAPVDALAAGRDVPPRAEVAALWPFVVPCRVLWVPGTGATGGAKAD